MVVVVVVVGIVVVVTVLEIVFTKKKLILSILSAKIGSFPTEFFPQFPFLSHFSKNVVFFIEKLLFHKIPRKMGFSEAIALEISYIYGGISRKT